MVGMILNGLFSDYIFIVICHNATMVILRWSDVESPEETGVARRQKEIM